MLGKRGGDHNVTATRPNDVTANHILGSVVATLEKNIGLQSGNQRQRCFFLKDGDTGDCLETGKNAARLGCLYWARQAFQSAHGRIAVQPNNQPVTTMGSVSKQEQMSGMKQVETSICKANAQPSARHSAHCFCQWAMLVGGEAGVV